MMIMKKCIHSFNIYILLSSKTYSCKILIAGDGKILKFYQYLRNNYNMNKAC